MTNCTYRSIPLAFVAILSLATSLQAGFTTHTIQKQSPTNKSLAILIGISGMQAKQMPPLPGVKEDLKIMTQALRDHCGCKQVVTITDDGKGRGTYDDIMARLRAALLKADKEKYDTVWVYFTGHAAKLPDGRLVLAPTDCDKKHLKLTTIPADLIAQLLADCKCKQQYLVLDCGNAAAVSTKQGVCVMASSQPEQQSYESRQEKSGKSPGVFTSWLCRGLGGEADLDKDKNVSLNELAAFATVHVAEEVANKLSRQQTPLFSVSDSTIVSTPTQKPTQRQADAIQSKPTQKATQRQGELIEQSNPKQKKKPGKMRIGLFVGISKYQDSHIRNLHVCHKDAADMAAIMKEHGQLDGIGLLLDEEATRTNIEKAFNELATKSKPGDEIFIYWSGYGASCVDTNGDEEDGRDEFLMPYDGEVNDQQGTTILDDTFSQWVRALDGRRVVVIIDASHAAGVLDDAKTSGKQAQQKVSQTKVSGLFSSGIDEIAAARRDGKGCVMTNFLLKIISETDSPLTIKEAYDNLKVEVPNYMQKNFPGRLQTPVLIKSGQEVFLKPKQSGIQVQQRTAQALTK